MNKSPEEVAKRRAAIRKLLRENPTESYEALSIKLGDVTPSLISKVARDSGMAREVVRCSCGSCKVCANREYGRKWRAGKSKTQSNKAKVIAS